MKVVSLFDGIGCGLVALKRCNIEVTEYHAFEIDKQAIAVANKNHPEIIQHGSVVGFDFSSFSDVDLVIGGSPCQGFSNLGTGGGFLDHRSKLFFEYLRAIEEIKPKFFLLENVRMKKEWTDKINDYLGVPAFFINSKVVSAQQRPRNYWFNWSLPSIQDKNVFFKDIHQEEEVVPNTLAWHKWFFENKEYQLKKGFSKILSPQSKTLCFTARSIPSWCSSLVPLDNDLYRFLTPIEVERCQTLPDNYTANIPQMQRYKTLGNAWTVDVICEILNMLKFY
jgi:site-specific DNA-cytosine methylase